MTALSANVTKMSILLIASAPVLSSRAVESGIEHVSLGIAVTKVEATEPSMQMVRAIEATRSQLVIVDRPTSVILAAAERFPQVRFVLIGASPPSVIPANETWIVPHVTLQAASLAGYAAGGMVHSGKVIEAVYGNTPLPTPQESLLLPAISSGIHAAFSNAPVLPIAAQSGQTLPVSGVGAYILLDAIHSSLLTSLKLQGTPIIDLSNFPANNAFIAQQVHAILAHFERGGAWKSQQAADVTVPALAIPYTGWQGAKGIEQYATELGSHTISPTSFALFLPSRAVAQKFGLPVKK